MQEITLFTIFLFGIFTSFGHCIGMCGGIVVAYTASKIEKNSTTYQLFAHLLYSLGRVFSYTLLGFIIASFGSIFIISDQTRLVFIAIFGLIMVIIGLNLLGKIKFLNSVQGGIITKSQLYKSTFLRLIESKKLASFAGIGVLNGLIPCGAVYAALAMSISLGSPLESALAMAVFGFATIPSLLLLGLLVGFMKQFHLRDLFSRLAAITVILFGLFTIFHAASHLMH